MGITQEEHRTWLAESASEKSCGVSVSSALKIPAGVKLRRIRVKESSGEYAQRGPGARATGGAAARVLRVGHLRPCQPAQLRGAACGVGGGAVGLRDPDDRRVRMVAGPVLRRGEPGCGLRAADVSLRRAADRPLRLRGDPGRVLGGRGGLRPGDGGGFAGMVFYAIYVPGRAVFSSPLELGTTTAISNWFIRRRPHGPGLVRSGAGGRTGGCCPWPPPAHRRTGLALGVGLAGECSPWLPGYCRRCC